MEQTLSFNPGIARLCLNITILDDNVYEGQNEEFGVMLHTSDPVVSYIVRTISFFILDTDGEFYASSCRLLWDSVRELIYNESKV